MQETNGQEIVYVNGSYCAGKDAAISIYDRGFLMSDAVYEVTAVAGGRLIDNTAHLARLARSLGELNIALPLPLSDIAAIQQQIIERNQMINGAVYLQVSRGAGPRDFLIDRHMQPTLVLFPYFYNPLAPHKSISVQTQPDIRWLRRDIKTTQLLAQSLAKSIAHAEGCDDAWLVDEHGFITEGSASNAYIVKAGRIFTRPADSDILNGITRRTMLELIADRGWELVETAFTPKQAILADEAFITSAGQWATAVTSIDGHTIGTGRPGPVSTALHKAYHQALSRLSQP